MASDSLQIIDRDNDAIRFGISAVGTLQLFVQDELHCASVKSIEYDPDDARVVTEGSTEDERGAFLLLPETQASEAEALRALAARVAAVEWCELERLPSQIEALLIDDTLRSTRLGTRILWETLKKVYPSEEAALIAVQRNSALVLPYLNKPFNIEGSWRVLLDKLSEAEALDVITKNPGVLASNPVGLAGSSPAAIKQAAGVVNMVEAVPVPARYAASAAVTLAAVGLIGSKFADLSSVDLSNLLG
jgi:hypothetical protein